MNLLGAAFTAAVCWALGTLLFRMLSIRLRGGEHELLAGLTGAALLSLLVFCLCSVGAVFMSVFLVMGLALIPAARGARIGVRFPASFLGAISAGLLVFYGAIYLSNSLAPEVSPDGMAYHLALVSRYFEQHGFERLTTSMYANLPQGMEMLFLVAFAIGRHSAAATVHCFFLFTLPLLMTTYGRRIGHGSAGLCAGMLVFLSPLAGVDGSSAYNDVALATTAFALFYLLEIRRETGEERLVIPIGMLAGFCFAIKYTGFVAILYMLVRLRPRRAIRALAAAMLMAVPWLVKNWITVGNPFSPFMNRMFPNPYIHISFESNYRHYFQSYGQPSLMPLFRMVTVTGELGGQLGPVFLLAPLALLSLRTCIGRRCLLAGLFFLLPYPANIGARFLLPALPFVALSMALALEFRKSVLAILVALGGVLAWPRVIDGYRAPSGGWQIATVPWQAALRIEPEPAYLNRRSADYRIAETINVHVPAGKRVFTTAALAEAYVKPHALVNYYSAEGEATDDILLTAVLEDRQPRSNLRFTFAAKTVDHVRIIQTAGDKDDIWSIAEASFFDGDHQIPAGRADASAFPWSAGLAIDGSPVTRWRSWEPIRNGMHFDVWFPHPVRLDRVELHCSNDQGNIRVRLEGIDAKVQTMEDPPLAELRPQAIRAIAAHRIHYLWMGENSPAARDIRMAPERWKLHFEAEQGSGRLYRIDDKLLPRR